MKPALGKPMKSKRLSPVRYQLKKEAAHALLTGHPWIYRQNLSSAAEKFVDGQWLVLYDAKNEILGYGIYEKEGLIGIRVLKVGSNLPNVAWLKTKVQKALARRENVRKYTDAFRAIHGENDGLPGVVIDIYGKTAVLQTYAPAVDVLGRMVAAIVREFVPYEDLIWKLPTKRKTARRNEEGEEKVRVLRGHLPAIVKFKEGAMTFAVEIGQGQKSGSFLDLRGLRKWISLQKWPGKRVLNLFSYAGTLGRAAEAAGAKEIWNVDIAPKALEFGKRYHVGDLKKYHWVTADIFKWIDTFPAKEKFDVIIVDPPLMASKMPQVPNALRAYRRIYSAMLPHLNPGGTMIAACCTSRINRKLFLKEMEQNLGGQLKLTENLASEDDHPVGFPEGDYLKMLVYKKK